MGMSARLFLMSYLSENKRVAENYEQGIYLCSGYTSSEPLHLHFNPGINDSNKNPAALIISPDITLKWTHNFDILSVSNEGTGQPASAAMHDPWSHEEH